eukprot:scaffold94237_cov26-Tisochrysis_lutea.AAC.1
MIAAGALIGLCQMGCESAPASLRLSRVRESVRMASSAFFQKGGSRLAPKIPSVSLFVGIVDTTAALPRL